ncbi:hypothetical protein BN946_scf184990.g28 [Trametes cinnabarina]|uniref:Uncharacterized protein n=1 Tax=Pycnoporus cinnabarinus TaxID=5643 RepID=A0A060SEF4_PYCCI|nr:hypothetical protein BN946_scf184990.g28 [Trametes cinnabarina]
MFMSVLFSYSTLTKWQDWVVPFIPGTQFQMCMVASNGVTGGCQNIWTVYQRPNTTLNNPPTCFNLTYPHAPLGVDASLADGTWSQYGWVDQCSDIQLKPTNGTPPFTYTIAPALHPPFNLTSNTMDPVNWTVSLMYGMPFWVSVVDSTGLAWTNGPLHPTGAGSTKCLDLDDALNSQSTSKSNSLSAGATAGIAIGTAIAGALLGILASFFFTRWQHRHYKSGRPGQLDLFHKYSDAGDTPTLGMHQPVSASTTLASPGRAPDGGSGSDQVNEHGEVLRSPTSPTDHHRSSSTGSGSHSAPGPSSTSLRSPLGTTLGQGGNSQVYVVHHDAGRPPPVTVFTSNGTEVVELPPQYETAAGRSDGHQGQQTRALGPRPLPLSPDGQRRSPRELPQKARRVATNADVGPSES